MHSSSTSCNPDLHAGLDLGRARAAIAPVLAAHDVSLCELEWLTDRGHWTLRLTIERPGSAEVSGGVTLEDCAEVSRDVSAVLDAEDLVPHAYQLEVSSPGLDRPLRSAADFARFAGRTARVKLSAPAPDGQRLLRGPLAAAGEGKVAVLVDGKRIEVPLADVVEARLVFELAPQPKKGGRQGKGGSGKTPGAPKR